MKNASELRQQFLRGSPAVRLGGLAANLARVQSFSDHEGHGEVVRQLLEESKWLIEWTAPEAQPAVQALLVDCQRNLARWTLGWAGIWSDPERRKSVSKEAGEWSRHLLELSGLLSDSRVTT